MNKDKAVSLIKEALNMGHILTKYKADDGKYFLEALNDLGESLYYSKEEDQTFKNVGAILVEFCPNGEEDFEYFKTYYIKEEL